MGALGEPGQPGGVLRVERDVQPVAGSLHGNERNTRTGTKRVPTFMTARAGSAKPVFYARLAASDRMLVISLLDPAGLSALVGHGELHELSALLTNPTPR